jgi:drug/metabolite transporter (DMT)-like permease
MTPAPSAATVPSQSPEEALSEATPTPRVVAVLGLAVAAVSTAAILVRLVPEMHPVAIAFWRTVVVAVLLLPALVRGSASRPRGRELAWTILAGLCLALHFWAWFASLNHTTVMRSTVLVCLTPVWAGLLGWGTGQDRPKPVFWAGISVALVGVVGMSAAANEVSGSASLLGDGLALLGGMLSAVYLIIGRRVRQGAGIGSYGALVTGACALWLLPAAAITGADLIPPHTRAWIVLGVMALGPQLLGHIGFNYAVRYVSAAIVGAVILLEPVGATALATIVLDEWPTILESVGAAGIVLGVFIATVLFKNSAARTAD